MYIDFGKSPVEESVHKPTYDCGNCIHKIFIPGGVYRCSITNKFMFGVQKTNEPCKSKDENNGDRKYIVGLFTYNKSGDSSWTGVITFGNIHNIDDTEAFKEINVLYEKELSTKFPHFKNMVLLQCLIAESRDNKPFVSKTDLLSKSIVDEIIDDANKRFL